MRSHLRPSSSTWRAWTGHAFSTVTNPATFTNLSVGTHTLEVEAEDQAANVSQFVSYTWTIRATHHHHDDRDILGPRQHLRFTASR